MSESRLMGVDEFVSPETLAMYLPPEPEKRHYPVAHSALLECVKQGLKTIGYDDIVSEEHGITHGGNRYFGLLGLGDAGHNRLNYVGLRSSYDKSLRLMFCLASEVMVCGNMDFCGDIVIGRKHTKFAEQDLPRKVAAGMAQLVNHQQKQEERWQAYNNYEFGENEALGFFLKSVDAGVVSNKDVVPVIREWRHPRHYEFSMGGRTAWRMQNAFTEVMKDRELVTPEVQKRTQRLQGMLDGVCRVLN